ncbi:Hypothetical_protein [Hexamita inflata]|uniref:Hypothetical_protein n=1 Tax=Hexamita inflata TaxID=28002 RepID=A0AA86UFF4_9EUKA|nr:Hypothetical protein HINF_LOCUS36752 [Hexamita inflata]
MIVISNSKIQSESQSVSISGGVFGQIDGVSTLCVNTLYGLSINTNIESKATNSYSYSSGIAGYVSNVNHIHVEQCLVYNSSIKSTSQFGQSQSSGIMSYLNYSNINFEHIQINNISVQSISQNNIGISAGYIAQITLSTIYSTQINVTKSIIQSNSCSPISAGIVGYFNYSDLIMQSTFVFNSIISGSDQQYTNLSLNTTRQSSGVLSFVYYSNVKISKTSIQDSNITMISNLDKAATGGIIGWLLYSSSIQKYIEIQNVSQYIYSLQHNSHSGGFNSVVDQSVDYQYNNIISNSVINTINGSASYSGSINGYVAGSNVYYVNIQASYVTLISSSTFTNYCGGLVGIVTSFGVVLKESQLEIDGSRVFNVNIRITTVHNGVAGSVIGFITQNSNITINNIKVQSSTNNITAKFVFAGSFAGSQWSQSNNSFVKITNSEIYSVKIYYQNQTTISINFIICPQFPELTNSLIQISSTKSLGFSSINGISVSNCENVQVQQINGNNFISENGCL